MQKKSAYRKLQDRKSLLVTIYETEKVCLQKITRQKKSACYNLRDLNALSLPSIRLLQRSYWIVKEAHVTQQDSFFQQQDILMKKILK